MSYMNKARLSSQAKQIMISKKIKTSSQLFESISIGQVNVLQQIEHSDSAIKGFFSSSAIAERDWVPK